MGNPSDRAPTVPAPAARKLLLRGQGLLRDPARRATPASSGRVVRELGFVQVDSINVVERAHHQILGTRLDGYRREHLTRLLEHDRSLFEHWTHDASVIPIELFPFWRNRFAAYRRDPRFERWVTRKLGPDGDRVLRHVWRRITREGPLMTRDFIDRREGERTGWWDWKPERAALEMLWRLGRLSIAGRRAFHKVFDRTDRVFPGIADGRRPSDAAHRAWACRFALLRLGTATPTEIARFLLALPIQTAREECVRAERRGDIERVSVESADGSPPRLAYALPDWRERASRAADPPDRIRILSPFDPLIHDRDRTQRQFGFEFRIECFVPAPKRRYGYYVLPLLEGDRFVGRIDPRLDRKRDTLHVNRVFWEPDIRPTRARKRALDAALARFAGQIGASRVDLPAASPRLARLGGAAGAHQPQGIGPGR